jgi:hypothetical protein
VARPFLFGVSGCSLAAAAAMITLIEVEEVEEVADGRAILRHIGIVVINLGVGEIVPAAIGQGLQLPVAFDELEDDYGP